MDQFKVGDKATVHPIDDENPNCKWHNRVPFGSEVIINGDDGSKMGCCYTVMHEESGYESYCSTKRLKLINQNNMEDFKITKDRILAAAAKCGTAKATLETLFPEAFKSESVLPEHIEVMGINGRTILRNTFRDKIKKNHIYLNRNDFSFEIVEDDSRAYLKVTPK